MERSRHTSPSKKRYESVPTQLYLENQQTTLSSRLGDSVQTSVGNPSANEAEIPENEPRSRNDNNNNNNNMADVLSTLNSVTQCFATLQSTVAHLMTKQRDEDSYFNLRKWYGNNQGSTATETPANSESTQAGIKSDSISSVLYRNRSSKVGTLI